VAALAACPLAAEEEVTVDDQGEKLGPPVNLLVNGNFVGSLSGWGAVGTATTDWVPVDSQGDVRSGAVRVTNSSSLMGGSGVGQCVPVSAGTSYVVSASAWLVPGYAGPGDAHAFAFFYQGTDCTGTGLIFMQAASAKTSEWVTIANKIVAPTGARSAKVSFDSYKATGAPGSQTVYFDRASFRAATCAPSAALLCLQGERFSVFAPWSSHADGSGTTNAGTVPFTTDSGSFYFLDPTNVEVNVKVLDGCGINGYFWVYAAGSTDQQVALHVTDTRTGAQKVYSSPFGKKFVTVTDIQAFPCVQTAAEP